MRSYSITHLVFLFLFLVLNGPVYAQDQDLQSKVDERSARMAKELNLTDSQVYAIKPIIKEYIAKREEILQNTEGQGILDHVAIKDTMAELKKKEYQKLSQILSQDQMEKWTQKENLRASLNQGGGESQVEDDVGLNPSGANFKF